MTANQNESQSLNFNLNKVPNPSNTPNQNTNINEKVNYNQGMYPQDMIQQGMMQQGMMQQGMMQQGMNPQNMMLQGMMQQGMMQQGMMQQAMIPNTLVRGMLIPQGIMLPNIGWSSDSLQILQYAPVAKVKQQMEFLELVTSCETKNRYDVYAKINEQNVFLFRCKEQSGWCMRNCCAGDCREFNLKLTLPNQQKFAILERPYKCTCCCCNRPIMTCKFIDGKQFGRISEPFNVCTPFFETYDEDDHSKYYLEIPYCQSGFCCRKSCCGKCNEVYGNIYNNRSLSNPVGVIKKKEKCVQETISDANTFVITFPVDATVNDKLNLIATVLMIDYRYFEDNETIR